MVRNDGEFFVGGLIDVMKRCTVDGVTDIFRFWRMDTIMALDRVMKWAEKNDMLRGVLAWIMSDIKRAAELTDFEVPQFEDSFVYSHVRPYSYSEATKLEIEIIYLKIFISLINYPVSSASELVYAFNAVVLRSPSRLYCSTSSDTSTWVVPKPIPPIPWTSEPPVSRLCSSKAPDLQGIYPRGIKDKSGAISHYKYEPRFTPPREKGTTLRFNRLYLGGYDTPGEAKLVRQIARFYYEKDEGRVQLEDGRQDFVIPPLSEEERALSGEEKRKWVSCKAKQVYADLLKEKRSKATAHTSHGSDVGNDSFQYARAVVTCSSPATTKSADDLEFLSEFPSVAPVSLPPCDATFVDMIDFSEALSGWKDMILYPELPNFSPQQSSLLNFQMQFSDFAEILGDPRSPQVGSAVTTQGIEHVLEPQSSPNQGWDLVGASGSSLFLEQSNAPVLQQLLQRQKKQLETTAVRIVGLEHQLSESQIRNSELQREKERLQQENEHLRTRLQQVAKSQVAA